jgi:leader peptidase (prepilin peptidase)/N-methyltransferase
MDALLWPLMGALAGLVAGSFLATLVLRWPRGEGLGGRSRCEGCGRTLGLVDLVPLVSWALWRGRCRTCGGTIDWRHPAIEAAAALIGAASLWVAPGLAGVGGALLGWGLLACLALDAEHYWLPDALTLPLLGLGLLLAPFPLEARLIGAALGGGAMLAVLLGFRAIRGRDGMGLGDVKLTAALGAWLSPVLLPPLILVAALLGLALAGLAWRRGKAAVARRLPFGACLAAAGYPLWLFAVGGGLG